MKKTLALVLALLLVLAVAGCAKGGGTIGPVISSHLPIPTVDMGVGLLAMHSACECMGTADQDALESFARAYYSGI